MDGTTIMEWDLVPPDMECTDLFFTEASYNQFSEKVDFSKQTISKYLELGSYSFNNKDLTDKIDETISFAECLQDSEQMTGESAASADKDVIEKRSAENNNLVQISESQNTSVVETRSNCETPLTRSTPLLSEEQTQNTSYGRKRKQYPRCSSLKNSEQNFYVSKLMIYQKTKPDPKCPDYQKFLKLHKKVHKEQKDFMIFLKKASVEFKNDYAFLPKIAKKYMQEKHEAMLNRLEKHGPFYFPIEQVPIVTKLYSKNVLQPVKILLQMGEVPVSFQFTNKNMKTILDYDVLQKKFPTDRIQQLNNNDAFYSHQVCSEDKNALDLAVKYQCDIVVSSSVLKCLVDNHAPQFEKGWDIPVCVQEYKIEGEEKPTHKVVFLDKPFHRKPSSRSINTIFHKFSLAARLLHVNHMSKHSFQPSTTVQKHDVCNDQCSQDINSLDDLIDVSSLETFGTSVSNTEPKTIIGKQNPKKRNLSEISPRTKKRMESISEKKSPKENFVKELFSDSLEENSETIQDVNSSFHSKTILEVEEKSQTDLVFTCSSGNPLQSPDQKEPFSLSKENRNNIQQQNTFQDIDSNSLSCQEKNHKYKRQDSSLKELNETEIKLNVEKIQKQNPRISKTCDTKKGKEIYDMLTVEENGTKLEKHQPEEISTKPEENLLKEIGTISKENQTDGIDMEPEEKQSEGIDMEPEKKQSEGIDMESEEKQSEGIDMESEKKQSEGIDMEPEKKQSEGIDMEPEKKQSEGIDMEPEKKQSEGIDMEPEKKQSEGIDMESEEKQSEGIDMESEKKQSEGIDMEPEKKQSEGIDMEPEKKQSEGIDMESEKKQSEGIDMESEKKQSEGIDMEPEKKQSEGIDLEPEKKQSEGIDMEPEKKQSEGIDMEPEKKQSEGIDMEPEKKQSEGIDMEPEKKQSEGIDMEPEKKQSEGIDMEPEKKQSEGIDMEPEKKQSEGIDMEPEKKQSEGIDMEPEKKQSEGIDMEPEEKQSEGIDMEPEKKQSEGIDMEPEKKQSEGIDMEPEEKQSEGIDMEPEEKQSEKISRKLEKNQSDGIGTKAANDVSEEINRKAIEHQSDGIIIEDKKKKDHIDTTPNNKEIQMEEDTDDDDDDSSSELVIHFESSDNEEDFQSETNQFLNKTEKSTCSPDRSKRKMTDSPQSLNSDLSPCPPECLASPTPDCPTSPTPDHPTSPTPDCPTSPTPDCPTSPTPDCPTSPTPECPASPTQQSPIPDCPASPLSEIQNSRSLSIQNDLLESFQKPMVIIPTESDGNVFDFCDIRTESPRNSVPPISRNAKRAIFPKKNHQRAFELGPLDNILEKQEELLKNTNKIKSTNKPAEMKCKNSPKKSINLETQENTEDFLAPKKGKNVTYCIWNLGDLRLLIRCKYSAVRKSKKSKEFVYLMPKLEYQIGFGYEQTTLSEASQMWISSLIRHNCIINRIRINAFSSLILMEEMLSFQQISQLYNPVAANSFLYNSFKKLSSLKPGSYCFSHSVGDNVSIISQAISKKSHHPSYSLKTLYPEYIVSDLPQEIPWVPLDTNMLMPFHKTHGRIPCTFNPSDQKGQKTNSKTKKKKKKKPKKK